MNATAARTLTRRPKFDSLEQEAYLNLWRTYDRLRAIEDELFGRYELSAQQYNALRLLKAVHPGALPTNVLGQRLISRAPDMTRLLDRLEGRGLVERQRRDDNRRVVEVSITLAGKALLQELAAQVRACHKQQLGHLSAVELDQLVALLKQAAKPHESEEDG
ncbi:MAG: MarR family transcriptional regulator [Planctomycetaceae bacterium]|nr:MarR family transcriptional regulator [Planctomycetaceae bacterium]